MKIGFTEAELPSTGAAVVLLPPSRALGALAKALDEKTGGAIVRALASGRFSGKAEEILTILAPAGFEGGRIVLVGTGDPLKITDLSAKGLGGAIVGAVATSGEEIVTVLADIPENTPLIATDLVAHMAFGGRLRSYRFDKYRTKEKPESKISVKKLSFALEKPLTAKKTYAALEAVADGVFLTRSLVSEPANALPPSEMAAQCMDLEEFGVAVEVLDEKKLKKLGMRALLGVAQGSAAEPCVVVMRYNGAPEAADQRPVCFVGKGVTFDTGGISLKPADGMWDMKYDMAGAGAVIGAIRALAGRKAKVNVVGVVGLVENMPDGKAQRPGDVVTSMSGQTIEVLNTDAEGRLVLADAVTYAQKVVKPRLIVDLATLTGAILIALGSEYAGLFSTDETLSQQLLTAGKNAGEPLWPMPLNDAYDKKLDSDIADIKNISGTRDAGSSTGAHFIKRFIEPDMPWAHLDIAGMAWNKADSTLVPKGASGFGVRLLERFIAENYEE